MLEGGRLQVGGATKVLHSDDPHDNDVLRGYLGLLYGFRDTRPGTEIPLRDQGFGRTRRRVGGTPEAIEIRLIELMDVTRYEAVLMRATLLRLKLLLAAAGLVLGVGLFAGAAKVVDQGGSTEASAPHAVTVAALSTDGVSIATVASVVTSGGAADIGDATAITVAAAGITATSMPEFAPETNVLQPGTTTAPPVEAAPPADDTAHRPTKPRPADELGLLTNSRAC